MLPPAYASLPAIEPRLITCPVFLFLNSTRLNESYDAGLNYAPLMNNWVRAIKPNTLVANMLSILSRDRSPTLSTPTTYPALLTATEFSCKKMNDDG